jgi:hypothetical protein
VTYLRAVYASPMVDTIYALTVAAGAYIFPPLALVLAAVFLIGHAVANS